MRETTKTELNGDWHIDENALVHGGNIQSASQDWGIPEDQWLDLSTGISPFSYPVEDLPSSAFQRLPYLNQAFLAAAKQYYLPFDSCTQNPAMLPIAGSQIAIQTLPKILRDIGKDSSTVSPVRSVLIPSIGYQEHQKHWQASTVDITLYPAMDIQVSNDAIHSELQKKPNQHVVVINPNNPSGVLFTPDALSEMVLAMGPEAYLIVDEAFIDLTPESSLLLSAQFRSWPKNLIVLRSFGKFYGLAGIRLGFVFAHSSIIRRLSSIIDPWSINGPAQAIAQRAFLDLSWQVKTREKIAHASSHYLDNFQDIVRITTRKIVNNGLFTSFWLPSEIANIIDQVLKSCGILVRLLPAGHGESIIRIGLFDVTCVEQFEKFSIALVRLKKAIIHESATI